MKQAHRDSTSLLRDSDPGKNNNAKKSDQTEINTRPLFDKAICLMIEREETLLGDILQQCDILIHTATQQVSELKKELEVQS